MKIRQGFISNSSSSSYIVFIPKNFEIDKKELDEWAEDMLIDFKRKLKTAKNAKKCIEDALEKLKRGEILYSDESPAFFIIEQILSEKDFVITEYPLDSSCSDSIENIGYGKSLNKIKKAMEI